VLRLARRLPSEAHIHKRYSRACSLDRSDAENSAVDTRNHQPWRQGVPKTYSHIINLPPMSTGAVDTPLIPHLSPSSCNERKRCGIGFGGRLLLCVFRCCECMYFYFYRGAEQVVMQMTSKGMNPFSAPRTPVPLTQFIKQAAGAEMKKMRFTQPLARAAFSLSSYEC
jgi:hypothetical protein